MTPQGALRLVLATSLMLLCAGCLRRVPVTYRVIDADSGSPIVSATVSVKTSPADYQEDFFAILTGQIGNDQGRTGNDGRVTLNVPSGRLPISGNVSAHGYMPGKASFGPHWARSASDRPVEREVALYPLPRGKAVIVLPDGFRGPLRVISHWGGADYAPGKRVFEVPAELDGITAVPSFEPVLPYGSGMAFQLEARFASSSDRLPKENYNRDDATSGPKTSVNAVALRLVAMNDVRSIFVVGTATDATEFQNQNGLTMGDPARLTAFERLFPKPSP